MIEKRPTFFIKKNSTLPVLKFPITSYIMEKYDITEDMLDNCAVTFSLYDVTNDVYKIANKEARLHILDDLKTYPDEEKYTLEYKFSLSDTNRSGNFDGEFKVDFLGDACGKITFPVSEKLKIAIQDSITKTTIVTKSNQPNITYGYYYGVIPSLGAQAGQNRPVANTSLFTGGTSITINGDQTLIIPYNSSPDDYIWLAIPSSLPDRKTWYVSDLNQGQIGGIVDDGGNLFPDAEISGGYKFYIANYQTAINVIYIKNF